MYYANWKAISANLEDSGTRTDWRSGKTAH